jgi:hypothetical protein
MRITNTFRIIDIDPEREELIRALIVETKIFISAQKLKMDNLISNAEFKTYTLNYRHLVDKVVEQDIMSWTVAVDVWEIIDEDQ